MKTGYGKIGDGRRKTDGRNSGRRETGGRNTGRRKIGIGRPGEDMGGQALADRERT